MRRTVIPPLALTIAAVLAFAGQAVAQIEGPYHLMAGLAPGIGERAAAMGDAQVAVARDATALYWNPAALALSGRRQWHVGSAHFEGYHLDLDELGDMLSIAHARGALGRRHLDLLRSVVGGRVEAGASAFSAYRSGRWAMGAFAQAWSAVDVTLYPQERYWVFGYGMDATNVGVAYGDSFSDKLHWGLQVGWLKAGWGRTKGSVLEHQGEVVNSIEYRSNHATGWSTTAGLLYQPGEHVTWGLVARNLNSPRLEFEAENTQEYDPSVHLGFAAENPEERVLFALDLHNVFEANDVDPDLCVGLEKGIGSSTVVRVGGTRDRLTWGVGVETGNWQMDLAAGGDPTSQVGVSTAVEF